MELILQGNICKLKGGGKASGRKRGKCTLGGSRKSLRRLGLYFAAVEWESYRDRVLFLTLTLPDEVHNVEAFGDALVRFRKWLLRCFPQVGAFVRIEQGGLTGRLHAHVVVFGVEFISANVLRRTWGRCLGLSVPVRIGVEKVRSGKVIALYLRKYMVKMTAPERDVLPGDGTDEAGPPAKPGDTSADAELTLSKGHIWQGRVWQVWGRSRIRFAPCAQFFIDGATQSKLVRILRRLYDGVAKRKRGASLVVLLSPLTVRQLQWWCAQQMSGGILDEGGGRCWPLYESPQYDVECIWQAGDSYACA